MLKFNSWPPVAGEVVFTQEAEHDLRNHPDPYERARIIGYYATNMLTANRVPANEATSVIDFAIGRVQPPFAEDTVRGLRSGAFLGVERHLPALEVPTFELEGTEKGIRFKR